MADALDSQGAAFAHLLGMSGHDADTAFRQACALAEGLFPHQIEGVAFLLGRRRAILADDMGLGKTRQATVSPRHLAPAGPYFRCASMRGGTCDHHPPFGSDAADALDGSRTRFMVDLPANRLGPGWRKRA